MESPLVFSQLHCTVPAYNFPVTALAIAPNTNNLVIAHSDQQVSGSSAFRFPSAGPALGLRW